jgi:predicted nucleic acid-binding protein
MPVYYLDTSALVKRYALEAGTTWMVELTDRSTQNDLFTARITGPEMIAAVFRKVRTGELGLSTAMRAAADFR